MNNTAPYEPVWAIGLMSGTSLDGVDAALVKTDGIDVMEVGPSLTVTYEDEFRDTLSRAVRQSGDIPKIALDLTVYHASAVLKLLEKANMKSRDVKVIGFHGQTISHRPNHGITWQIGDAALLASMTGIDVVFDFRSMDVAQGGQGAPLVPLYHAAVFRKQPKPLAILNLGGIANVTWIDKDGVKKWIQAFETGPGNALIDDMVMARTGEPFDRDGKIARSGKPDETALKGYFYDPYFDMPPPKTLDRHDFALEPVIHLDTADAVATLVEFTVRAIVKAQEFFHRTPQRWLVAGGGRHNVTIMKRLKDALGDVQPVEAAGVDGDSLEAQAFAYLAMRSIRGLPISLPETTGVPRPVSGGAFYRAGI